MSTKLIEKIKEKGYWRVIARPVDFAQNRIENKRELKKIIEKSKIVLRGWDYPHIDHKNGIINSGSDSVSSFSDWPDMGHIEYWKYYLNGQFIHYFGMREDYRMDEEQLEKARQSFPFYNPEEGPKLNKFLSVLSTLYSVTEIYYLTANLAKYSIKEGEMEIRIEIHGTTNRTLFFWGGGFRELFQAYTCAYEPVISENILNVGDLIDDPASLALKATMEIFNEFNWSDPNPSVFIKDQTKFIERRL